MLKRNNIVLLHGWGASSEKLSKLSNELTKLGFNVFLPKLPGFEIKPPSESWNVSDYSNYVIDRANIFFKGKSYYIFGHSFGGRVAIKSANQMRVSGIILCATGGVSRPNLVKRVVFMIFAKAGKSLLLIKPLANIFRKLLYKLSREPDYGNTTGIMRQTFKRVVSEDLKKPIESISKPLLILWGDNDRMVSVNDAYKIKSLNRSSAIKIYRNQGHTLPYDQPEVLARDINKWIDSH